MRVKEENERASLKLNIKKTKIMESGPITSWQIEGEKVEVVTDFLFLGSQITVDGDCQRIDAFELWCWRRLLRVPWTAGRSNQSILREN